MKPRLPLPGRGRKRDSDKKNGKRRRIDFQRAGLAIATIVVLSVLLCIHLLPDSISLSPGDTATGDIRAHMSVRYLRAYETEKRQKEAAYAVQRMYDRLTDPQGKQVHVLDLAFETINESRSDASLSNADEKAAHARAEIKNQLGIDVPLQSLIVIMKSPEPIVNDIRNTAERLLREAMKTDLRDDDPSELRRVRNAAGTAARQDLGTARYGMAASGLVSSMIRPNMFFNAKKTDAERKHLMSTVDPVYGSIKSGELIIASGQRVTQEHIEKFTALGLRQRRIDYHTALALTLLVSFLVVLVLIYLGRYQKAIYKETRLLTMLALVAVISTLCLKLGGGVFGIKLSGLQLAYLGMMFTTAAGMILAVLLNPQVAVLIIAMFAVVAGVVMNFELRYATSTLISGLVAIYSVANIRGRADLLRAFAAIAITNIALTWIMGGLFGDSLEDVAFGSAWAIVVIAFPAVSIFWWGTWLFERPFRVTTHISLLELADTNRPILKRLVVEAPGTYTHSMAVGHLAEAAAEAIGADSLFARVASYYHDIGKIRRPHFFVENQQVENAHDRLAPTLSALVITSHITDGLEVAKEFKLPPRIQDVIVQHHGTSLVQYFYNQASEQGEPSAVLEQQFRYDGPKPQTREAAIVMLADSVEAASRALAKPSIPALESLVHRVVSEKIQDGQLGDSDLTFKDIGIIEKVFINTLSATLHARIEYQESLSAESEKAQDNGNSDQELAATAGEPGQAEGNG